MAYNDTAKAVVRKMFFDTRIGGRHLGLEDLKRGFPSHAKGDVETQVKKLVKDNIILKHPAAYGMQYTLNPREIEKITEIIE